MRIFSVLLTALLLIVFGAGAAKPAADDIIYDDVRRRLANHPDVKGGAIEVTVKDGVVELSGPVRQEKARIMAEKVARKTKGVQKVINKLVVSSVISQP